MADLLPRDIATAQSVGQRTRQEDAVRLFPDGARARLLVLSDGMGGAVGGDVASRLITETVLAHANETPDVHPGRALKSCALAANEALAQAIDEDPELDGMGGTLVIVAVLEEGLIFFSIGDSPLWLVRSGALIRLNADHSVGGLLDAAVARGEMDAEQAAARRDRNALVSVLTGEPIDRMAIDETIDVVPMRSGDVLICASDGLDTLQADQILTAARGPSAAGVAQALLDAVEVAGRPRQDNTSVIVGLW
jgi:serine/threonine protein phosphatase PrpC